MDVEGQQVVLHEAPVLRLVLGDDAEVRFLSPCSQVDRFPRRMYRGAFLVDDIHGHLQSRCAVDAALTAMVVLAVGVQGDDLVAEETCRLRSRMRDQRLLLREFQLEVLVQERFAAVA